MPLAECPRSGKLINTDESVVHPDCLEEELEDYQKVLDYLAEHPRAALVEVADATEVAKGVIMRMLKQHLIEPFDQAKHDKKMQERLSDSFYKKRQERLAQELANLKLPRKPEVRVGRTVHETVQEKRNNPG